MNVLWLSNHPCSDEQKEDLDRKFGEVVLTELESEGKALWSAIPPEADLYEVGIIWWDVFETVHTGSLSDYDVVVVMGELSMCVVVVAACTIDRVAVYTPTTVRKSKEVVQEDSSVVKTNVFKHCKLRLLHDPVCRGSYIF